MAMAIIKSRQNDGAFSLQSNKINLYNLTISEKVMITKSTVKKKTSVEKGCCSNTKLGSFQGTSRSLVAQPRESRAS